MTEDTGNFETDPVIETPEPEPPAAPTGIQYVMFGDNSIARIDHDNDGQRTNLAKMEGGILIYESEKTKAYHAKVSEYLKEAGISVEGVYVAGSNAETLEGTGGTQSIPPPPLKNKRDGDKTAAFVDWMKKYKPDEFNAKYGVTGQGYVTKTRQIPDPEIPGRFTAEAYRVPALLSRRKTHLTEKPDVQEDEGFAPIPPKPEKGFE
jgi:hypothetical protein